MAEINIVHNGDLSGPYEPFRGDERMRVPAGWLPWWISQRGDDPRWKNQSPRVDTGEIENEPVALLSTPFATHTAGLLQQVPAAPGDRYELIVTARAVSTEAEDPEEVREPGDVNVQIGVDPTGGLDPTSPLVTWSRVYEPVGSWETLRHVVQAEANIMTVYLKSAPSRPKRHQQLAWREVRLRPLDKYRRTVHVVGAGDTHIKLEPEQPRPGEQVTVIVSSSRDHTHVSLQLWRPDGNLQQVEDVGREQTGDRTRWRYRFEMTDGGLYDIRFVGDRGARLLAQELIRVSEEAVLAARAREAPSGDPRVDYRRVYVLLPPTADVWWLVAAARGGFDGRYTVGFSADDAGVGNLAARHVVAVNPHHWPEPLTATWFHRNYPGTTFTPVIASTPEDLEAWLKSWDPTTADR
jgi:hypothetical protein